MASVSAWLVTFRLRTLPLSLSTIILGSFLAAHHHHFSWAILVLAALTTLFLQILSNLANDYGDAVSGVDNHGRIGPQRSLQTGVITRKQMKSAIILFVVLSLLSGICLVIQGTKGQTLSSGIILFVVGIAAITAALKYTMGKNPYGYAGLGDVSVFIFFGLVGVMGTYFLHTNQLTLPELLPASAIGCFSAGVLNLNNLRDRENDAAFGKRTIVVKLGVNKAKTYHALLLMSGMLAAMLYSIFYGNNLWNWIYLPAFVGVISSIITVLKNENPAALDPELKKLSLSTLLFALLFGAGLLL